MGDSGSPQALGEHSRGQLRPDKININARKVVRRLNEGGFQAYAVGGCVRDLLLGKSPKDYDVATDAHPEEVRDLFRNARIIGRRFRIVHVRFGRDVVEVATFRAPHNEAETEANYSDDGRILDDNIYGTFDEDVQRRDFTMNALYYQPETDTLIDEVGGLADIEACRIRLIGDPESRFREDPVRMLRAIRFRAKLGFDIEIKADESLRRLGYLLQDIPPARLFEETLKLFMTGHGEASFHELLHHELFGWLFPDARRVLETTQAEELIRLALASTDARIRDDKPVTPAFLYAALLWHPFVEERDALIEEGMPPLSASHEAASNIIGKQQLFTSIPKRFSGPMREIWNLQFRLPARHGKKAAGLFQHKRFRAAYDFLLIREESGESLDDLGAWWTEYQEKDEDGRREMVNALGSAGSGGKRRRRRPRRPRN